MKYTVIRQTAAVLILTAASFANAESSETIPLDYSMVSLDDPSALDFANSCGDINVDEAKHGSWLDAARENKVITHRPEDKTAAYLRYGKEGIYCVQTSPQGHPIVPLKVFERTIVFNEMSKEDSTRFYTEMSRQLALTGVAVAVLIKPNGNANTATYMFNRFKPDKIYYRSSFLTKDDLNSVNIGMVFNMPYKSVSSTNRGKGNYHYKSLYHIY